MMNLELLGNKICIIGCSASGKSTLGEALSRKLQVPVIHLDFLAHYQNTNWHRRPIEELIVRHTRVIAEEQWIIEGNYSVCMQERFQRATSIIWLDLNVVLVASRYLQRCVYPIRPRFGKLPGSTREFSFSLLKHIFLTYPQNRKKYQTMLQAIEVPVIMINSIKNLKEYYSYWNLTLSEFR